MAYDHE
jgi:Ca2+-binding EF-hand superfamily protein